MDENSEIRSIKIEYDDDITQDHMFPDSFWIEITLAKTADTYKFEFDLIDDPSINVPINIWKSDLRGHDYALHKGSDSESWASYQLVKNQEAIGVATLIRNSDKKTSHKHTSKHWFRMIGSVAFGDNFIEISPLITKEQQARKKRSAEESVIDYVKPGVYHPEFDADENSHLIRLDNAPSTNWAAPIAPSTYKSFSSSFF